MLKEHAMSPASRTILVADDSATQLMMHRMILGTHGYRLLTAQDGQEAVETAAAELPDLILMDVVMPRLTGFEAVRALRAQDRTRTIPIIMVTSRAEPRVIETCYEVGCNDYVNKPVDGPILLAKVRSFLGA
jgi:CheY-like chemotaxis protein